MLCWKSRQLNSFFLVFLSLEAVKKYNFNGHLLSLALGKCCLLKMNSPIVDFVTWLAGETETTNRYCNKLRKIRWVTAVNLGLEKRLNANYTYMCDMWFHGSDWLCFTAGWWNSGEEISNSRLAEIHSDLPDHSEPRAMAISTRS